MKQYKINFYQNRDLLNLMSTNWSKREMTISVQENISLYAKKKKTMLKPSSLL